MASSPERYDLDPEVSIVDQIHCLQNATMVPSDADRNWIVKAGVFTEQGEIFEPAIAWHSNGNRASHDPDPVETVNEGLAGTYLYGGVCNPHFGHFLVETTSRLWAIDHCDAKFDGIVFFSMTKAGADCGREMIARFLKLVGIDLPILIIEHPTKVETLYVPAQGFGAGRLMFGVPEFRAFIKHRFAASFPRSMTRKIYISRSKFSRARGSFLGEELLEMCLGIEGYEVFHPQEHSLDEQIACYKSASHIIGADASFFHLVAMVADADHKIAMIKRRPSKEQDWLCRHLTYFGAGQVTPIKAVLSGWSPGGLRRTGLSVHGLVSFADISRKLAASGMIREDAHWPDLTESEITRLLIDIGTELDADMYESWGPNNSLRHVPKRKALYQIQCFKLGTYPIGP